MAVEAVASGSGLPAASGTVSVGFTCTNAKLLLVGVGAGDADANPLTNGVASVVWNTSETLTRISGSEFDNDSFEGVAWYKLDNPTATTANVVVTATGTINGSTIQIFAGIISFTDTGLTNGTPSGNTGTSANPSVTVVDTNSGETVVSILANDEGGAVTQAGTIIGEVEGIDGGDSSMNAQYQTASGANTVCSWTEGATGAGWAASGMAVRVLGPTITDQPDNQKVYEGQTATFTIAATGTGTLHYQWKDDGSNVGTDSDTYAPTTTLAMNGSLITCVVTDDAASTTSNTAYLNVLPSSKIGWTRA